MPCKQFCIHASLILLGGLLATAVVGISTAQEETPGQVTPLTTEERTEVEDKPSPREQYRRLEKKLDELVEQIEAAERKEDLATSEKLREDAEQLLDRLDALRREFKDIEPRDEEDEFDRDEEEEERERFRREREEHRDNLELERAEFELRSGKLSMILQLAELAGDRYAAAAYAIMHVENYMEVEPARDFLSECLDRTEDASVRRLIRIKLAELHARHDDPDAAREHLQRLILDQ